MLIHRYRKSLIYISTSQNYLKQAVRLKHFPHTHILAHSQKGTIKKNKNDSGQKLEIKKWKEDDEEEKAIFW